MHKLIKSALVATVLSVFTAFCSLSYAQNDSAFAALNEIQNSTKNLPDLTSKRVKSWMTSYKKSQALNMPELAQGVKKGQTLEDVMKSLEGSKQYSKLLAIVKANGFSSVEQWTQVGMQVAQAYASLTINRKEINQQLQQSIADIKNNASFSEQQKQFMINMAKQAGGMMDSMTQSSAANKKAVKPHQNELKKLFDDK